MHISNSIYNDSIIVNKVTGQRYKVVGNTGDQITAIDVNATGEEKPESISIFEKNAICYRVEYFAPPQTVPTGFKLDEKGVLYMDNLVKVVTVNQGELRFSRIITGINGSLVLLDTKSRIFTYNVDRDKFERVECLDSSEDVEKTIKVLYNTGEECYISITQKKKIEENLEDGTVNEKIVLANGFIGCLTSSGEWTTSVNSDVEVTELYAAKGDSSLLFAKCIAEGEKKYDTPKWMVIETTYDGSVKKLDLVTETFGETFYCSTSYNQGQLLATENEFILGATGENIPLSDAALRLEGLYLVDRINDRNVTTFVFADEKCNDVKEIKVTRTKDRGFIVEA